MKRKLSTVITGTLKVIEIPAAVTSPGFPDTASTSVLQSHCFNTTPTYVLQCNKTVKHSVSVDHVTRLNFDFYK